MWKMTHLSKVSNKNTAYTEQASRPGQSISRAVRSEYNKNIYNQITYY